MKNRTSAQRREDGLGAEVGLSERDAVGGAFWRTRDKHGEYHDEVRAEKYPQTMLLDRSRGTLSVYRKPVRGCPQQRTSYGDQSETVDPVQAPRNATKIRNLNEPPGKSCGARLANKRRGAISGACGYLPIAASSRHSGPTNSFRSES